MQQPHRAMLPRRLETMRLAGAHMMVLLYLFAATPAAPAMTALLASADRSHQVAVQCTDHGVQVVMRHGCANSPAHRHGVVARALVAFARPVSSAQPDHVIQFGGADVPLEPTSSIVDSAWDETTLDAGRVCFDFLRASQLILPTAGHPRPPPGVNALLLTVRSTVLIL